MSKLNRSFLKKFNALLVALLGFLGFSACQSNEPGFVVRGKITNAETGQTIEGIRVSTGEFGFMYGPPMPNFNVKPVFSDRNGNFVKVVNDTTGGVWLHFLDVDGEKNGSFYSTDAVARFEAGSNTAVINVALTPKTENE